MRHSKPARRAGLPVAAAVLGVLVAGPALADVTVSPTSAPQGSGQNVTLRVTNDGDRPVHTIKLTFPGDLPLAEAYPLSVDDWAPKIEMRKLATPLKTLHGETSTTETAASITWLAMPGKDLAPGRSTDLSVAVGPLPTLSSMKFDVSTTYADGKPGKAMTPASIALTPDTTGGAAQGHGHGGAAAPQAAGSGEDQYFAQVASDAQRGPSFWSIGGWVVAGLALLGGAIVMFRGRHRADADEDDEPDDTPAEEPKVEEKEPVTAGGGNSKWAFKG
ncbi:DUF1775 domain-containing protein [Actinoplanes solisilvae]|uniref:DUF1775 domain-containing protein n=1 Tax=Actinoplanes solisilvae TaxID=2486853 RepID=UPI000FD6E569|nr:DUF1775 domain-containing protein [Actinoplanes solisilvae]